MKKSFILHIDSLDILDDLTIEQSGKLFKAIRDYHKGIEPELDAITKIAFSPFKNQFIRDNKQYIDKCEIESIKGKIGNLKRWHPDLYSKLKSDNSNLEELLNIAKHRHGDNEDSTQSPPIPESLDSDSDNDSDSKKDNNKSLVDKKSTIKSKTDSAKFFVECKELYFKFVKAKYNIEPIFTSKDGIALSKLLNLLEKRAIDKNPSVNYDLEFCLKTFTYVLNTAYQVEFIKNNFTIPILISQFNQILIQSTKNN